MQQLEFIVVDQQHADFAGIAWQLRRLADESNAGAFGRWLVSLERPRFMIVTPGADSVDEGFIFAKDEAELVALLKDRAATNMYLLHGVVAAPDVIARLEHAVNAALDRQARRSSLRAVP